MSIFKKLANIFVIIILLVSCKKERIELDFLIWEGYGPSFARDYFVRSMKEKYGIDVILNIKYIENEELLYNEIKNKNTDYMTISHYLFDDPDYQYIERELIKKIDTSILKNHKNIIKEFRELPFLKKDKSVYGVALENSSYRLVYDASKIPAPKSSWSILWEEQFKKKYSVSGYYFETNFYITALYTGYKDNEIFDIEKISKDKNFIRNLEELAKNSVNYWDDLETPEEIEGKEIATAFGNFLYKLKNKKENWKFLEPIEGVPGTMDFSVISSRVKNNSMKEKIIYEWIDFTLSDYYQKEVIINSSGEMPVITTLNNQLTEEQIQRYHLRDTTYYKEKRFLWPGRSLKIQKKMEDMWTKAMGKPWNK